MNKTDILRNVKQLVFKKADEVDWLHLTIDQRRKLYEKWTNAPEIGGVLNTVIRPERVRVYLKDTIIGEYCRYSRTKIRDLVRAIKVPCEEVVEEFIKPQAVLCDSHYLYTISEAKDWKISLLNSYERASERPSINTNKLYLVNHATGKFISRQYRALIEDAGKRLNVEVIWVD